MKKLPLKIIKLCKDYRTNGLSHRDISKKLNIGLGSVFKYSKDITLTRPQHLFLMRRNLPRITAEQRRNAGLHNPNKFMPKYSKKDLIEFIKSFVKNKKRIPTKREITSHKPYVRLFGSWNNAIKAGETLIEFLGLAGQLEKYDKLVKIKEKLWKEQNLKVIKIYPKDLFPENRLNEILKF